MVFQKRRSATTEKAQSRLRGLQSGQSAIKLGDQLTLQNYANLIETSGDRLQAYNLALAEADRTRIEFAEAEAAVSTFSSRILSGITAVYGKDSKEYELAGGRSPITYKRAKKQSPATSVPKSEDSDNFSDIPSSNGTAKAGAEAMA